MHGSVGAPTSQTDEIAWRPMYFLNDPRAFEPPFDLGRPQRSTLERPMVIATTQSTNRRITLVKPNFKGSKDEENLRYSDSWGAREPVERPWIGQFTPSHLFRHRMD